MPPPAFADTFDPEDPDFLPSVGAMFMASKMLFVASKLNLFAALADGPRTIDELSTSTGLPRRSLHVLLHGLASVRVVNEVGDRFANGTMAQRTLAGRGDHDMRKALRLFEEITWRLWEQLESSVKTGQPVQLGTPSAEFGRIFSEGVEAFTRAAADALPDCYDFSPHRRMLDLAGGTGSYLLPVLRKHPAIAGTLYELPPPAEAARRRLGADPHGKRVEVVEGDALFDPIPGGHDVVLLANTIHLFNPDIIQRLLQRMRVVVEPGARLLIAEHWVDSTHTKPAYGALLAGTFLLLAGDGRTYSVEEAQPWLAATGWKLLEHRPLAGAISLAIAEAAA